MNYRLNNPEPATPHAPSPAEFLAGPSYDEDDLDYTEHEPDTRTPLQQLADLEQRVTRLEAGSVFGPAGAHLTISGVTPEAQLVEQPAFARIEAAVEPAERAAVDEALQLTREALADLQAKHGTVLALVEEIRGIVKPSTSKVSLAVKAAIEAWSNPAADSAVSTEPTETPSPAPDAQVSSDAVDEAAPGELPAQDVQQRAGEGPHTRTQTDSGPDFCKECSDQIGDWVRWPCQEPTPEASVEEWRAYAVALGHPSAVVDTMNRSQIRTMLGIEQPVGA